MARTVRGMSKSLQFHKGGIAHLITIHYSIGRAGGLWGPKSDQVMCGWPLCLNGPVVMTLSK